MLGKMFAQGVMSRGEEFRLLCSLWKFPSRQELVPELNLDGCKGGI